MNHWERAEKMLPSLANLCDTSAPKKTIRKNRKFPGGGKGSDAWDEYFKKQEISELLAKLPSKESFITAFDDLYKVVGYAMQRDDDDIWTNAWGMGYPWPENVRPDSFAEAIDFIDNNEVTILEIYSLYYDANNNHPMAPRALALVSVLKRVKTAQREFPSWPDLLEDDSSWSAAQL